MDDYDCLLRLSARCAIAVGNVPLDKAAAATIPLSPGGDTITQLRRAKAYSDRQMFDAKHAILRKLLSQSPDEFLFDNDDKAGGKYVGITHRPSGFQMHGPRSLKPIALPSPVINPTSELRDILSLEKSVGQAQAINNKVAEDPMVKPYRDRAEVYAVKDGKLWGGKHDNGTFGVYGGGIDEKESAAEAASREFAEESGYNVTNVRPVVGIEAFGIDWKPPYHSKKQKERAKHYRGSRTHYFVADLGDKHNRKLVEPVKRTDVRLYSIKEAIRLCQKKLDDEDLLSVNKSRVRVLRAIQTMLECPAGECCPHCNARLERSEDGVCNSCGKDWPIKDAADSDIADLLLMAMEAGVDFS